MTRSVELYLKLVQSLSGGFQGSSNSRKIFVGNLVDPVAAHEK